MVEHDPVENIFIKNRSKLIRYAEKFVERDVAEDIIQEAFIRVNRRHNTRPITSPTAFISQTVYHSAMDHQRKSVYRKHIRLENPTSPDKAHKPIDIPDRDPSPEDQAIHQETSHQLILAIKQLPAKQRTAIVYFYLKGFSYPESADAMNIPLNTLKTNILRGIQKLHKDPNLIRMFNDATG